VEHASTRGEVRAREKGRGGATLARFINFNRSTRLLSKLISRNAKYIRPIKYTVPSPSLSLSLSLKVGEHGAPLVTQTGLTRRTVQNQYGTEWYGNSVASRFRAAQDFLINQNQSRFSDTGVHFLKPAGKGTRRELMKSMSAGGGFSSIFSNRCCFLSLHKRVPLPPNHTLHPCRRVGYGGNNVGALSKSAKKGDEGGEGGGGAGAGERSKGAHSRDNGRRRGGWYENGDGRKMKGEDSERGREYWLTCNTESGGGRDPANIKYIITFILISLLAPVCLLARLHLAMAPSAGRARTTNAYLQRRGFPSSRALGTPIFQNAMRSCPFRRIVPELLRTSSLFLPLRHHAP